MFRNFALYTWSILVLLALTVSAFGQGWNIDRLGYTYHNWINLEFVEISGDYAYLSNDYYGFVIVDISDPMHPQDAGFVDCPYGVEEMVITGGYLYITTEMGGLRIFNIDNPLEPFEIGHYGTDVDRYTGLAVLDHFAYVTSQYFGVYFVVLNISDPQRPRAIGQVELGGYNGGVAVDGNYAYVATGEDGFYVIDIIHPTHPHIIARCATSEPVFDIVLTGDIATASCLQGIYNLDISDPANPSIIGSCTGTEDVFYLSASDSIIYSGNGWDGMVTFDITDPENPVITCINEVDGFSRGGDISGDYYFLSNCGHDIINVFDITTPTNPVEVSSYGPGWIQDVDVNGDYAYLATAYGGLKVVDISDYSHPLDVAYLMLPGGATRIEVVDTVAYIAADSGGLRIVDIADPLSPYELGFYNDQNDISDIKVVGNLVFTASRGPGITILDITDPANPLLIGQGTLNCEGRGIDVEGNYAYIIDDRPRLHIVDISNPALPVQVGGLVGNYTGERVDVCGNYAYLCLHNAGLWIVDVSDPTAPFRVSVYDEAGAAYDVTVTGDYAFLALLISGLHILDISDPENPYEVGEYITSGQNSKGICRLNEFAFLADDEYFHIFNCSAAIGNVEPLGLSIEPTNPPIIIPPSGGQFWFEIGVENPNIVSVWFDLWGQIDLPGGGSVETINIDNCVLPGNGANTYHFQQGVPFYAPAGLYTYYAYIGDYPWQVAVYDSFTFVKEGAELSGYEIEAGDWLCSEVSAFENLTSIRSSTSINYDYKLYGAYPNPFNENTVISFDLPSAMEVELKIYDINGREVQSLVNGQWSLGKHSVEWDAEGMPSGVYFVRLKAGDFNQVQKMVLMK